MIFFSTPEKNWKWLYFGRGGEVCRGMRLINEKNILKIKEGNRMPFKITNTYYDQGPYSSWERTPGIREEFRFKTVQTNHLSSCPKYKAVRRLKNKQTNKKSQQEIWTVMLFMSCIVIDPRNRKMAYPFFPNPYILVIFLGKWRLGTEWTTLKVIFISSLIDWSKIAC